MEGWGDFFVAEVGAAAALAGLLVVASVLPHSVGGLLLVAGNPSGLYWIAVGIILGLVVTLENGWVLLIEILR